MTYAMLQAKKTQANLLFTPKTKRGIRYKKKKSIKLISVIVFCLFSNLLFGQIKKSELQSNKSITISLQSIDDWNIVLTALSKVSLPMETTAPVFFSIREQLQKTLQQPVDTTKVKH